MTEETSVGNSPGRVLVTEMTSVGNIQKAGSDLPQKPLGDIFDRASLFGSTVTGIRAHWIRPEVAEIPGAEKIECELSKRFGNMEAQWCVVPQQAFVIRLRTNQP